MRIFIGVALLAAACTDPITDGFAGSDDGTPPPAGTVQITVRDGSAPQANVDVLFQNSDGTIVVETKTDATGVATASMHAGNVTVARTFAAGSAQRDPEIYTYVGVAAGDNLVLGDPTDDTGAPTTINVTVPSDADGNVTITSACGTGQGTAPTVTMSVAGCPPSVMFFVEDDDDDSFVATAPYSANIDLSAGLLDEALNTTFGSTDVTPDMSAVDLEAYAMDGTHELYDSGAQSVDGSLQTVDLPSLRNVDELVVATISSSEGTQMVSSRTQWESTPKSVNASANLLPYVSSPTYNSSSVTWSENGTGTADFVVSTLAVTGSAKYTRYIIAPHASTTLAVPTLAGADSIYNPGAADTIVGAVGIGTMTGGYAAARVFAFTTPNIVDGAPMGGTLTLSYAGSTAPTL